MAEDAKKYTLLWVTSSTSHASRKSLTEAPCKTLTNVSISVLPLIGLGDTKEKEILFLAVEL